MADIKSTNLHAITKQLRSDKVKERQEGLSQLRACFANERIILNIDKEGNGQGWLVIYQALFDVFDKEKVACTKKGSLTTVATGPGAAALRRLSEVAGLVRYAVERSCQRLNGKVVRPLLAHLLSNIKYRGKLLAPVSLDYVKAITDIVGWRPHLEHIDEDTWLTMVELGFNVLLGDSFRTRFEDGSTHESREESISPESPAEPSETSDHEEDVISSPSKKRRYAEAKPTQRLSAHPGSSTKPQDSLSVSKEHIEFAHLLSILLGSTSAPILSPRLPFLPVALLDRLQRFLSRYPTDTSLHHHYLLSVSAVLSHLALNRVQLVTRFAKDVWSSLVDMWGTKNQSLKEDLVVILRTLFPYLTSGDPGSPHLSNTSHIDGITKLWRLLDGEAHSRWGVDGLPLESLRLHIQSENDEECDSSAFVGRTFRHGWHFGPNEALTWAILELQADCTEKLFSLLESAHSIGRVPSKRVRLENPVVALLSAIRVQTNANVRAYHLQSLLFFIDRHWNVMHDDSQREVTSAILQFLSYDDPLIQSWSFMCFAAIAHAVGVDRATPINPSTQALDNSIWDSIWTHAMRRSNVPAVCRAACHVAHTMLHHAKALLSPQRVLTEIETLAKDLDVQGPSFPYDSVCGFLVRCIRVASQDVRLYRMQLEEKVLTWLMDSWRPSAIIRSKMPLHCVEDVLNLLEHICGTNRKAQLVCQVALPDCRIVEALTEDHSTAIIRNFLLHAQLPPFRAPSAAGKPQLAISSPVLPSQANAPGSADLALPRGRERRISGFLLKSLEDLIQIWETPKDILGPMTAERTRSSLDFAIIALLFESTLVLDNTRSNRRNIQAACKLLRLLAPLTVDSRWTITEKALIVSAWDPLILSEPRRNGTEPWESLLLPEEESGIRREVLNKFASNVNTSIQREKAARIELQRVLFYSSDVQDAMSEVMGTLRDLLRAAVGHVPDEQSDPDAMHVDDHDDFGPSRVSKDSGSPSGKEQVIARSGALRQIVDVCVTSLSVFPVLQSSSGESTRDKQLTELVVDAEGDAFLLLAPAYLNNVRHKILNVNLSAFESLLEKFELLLRSYNLSRSTEIQILTIQLLHSTMHIWIQEAIAQTEIGENVQGLCEWLASLLSTSKLPSWVARDLVVRFLDDYFPLDPGQKAWPEDIEADFRTPVIILTTFGGDQDVRVRFRAAAANARLLHFAPKLGVQANTLYHNIRQNLSKNLDEYESLLTRFICLGNIVVVNSAVRRGPYWHLLEAALYSNEFTRHIETVLKAVSTRLGMSNYSELFELYASQIATSIRDSGQDFLRFPPHILGYRDRLESAAATFRTLTPANVLASGSPSSISHGRKLFENHCKILHKTPAQGMQDCFSEVIGYQIVFFIDKHMGLSQNLWAGLDELLQAKTSDIGGDYSFDQILREHADGIVTAIVRALGDQDISPHGPIATSLGQEDADALPVFLRLCAHRKQDGFEPHQPNLPAYPTLVILEALEWFNKRVPYRDNPAMTYHVLHRLFAELLHSPLVNEQLRLLNALSLWISCHKDHFQDLTVLRTLFNGATSLLTQYDLCRGAQSLLEWGLSLYQDGRKDSRLAEILLRIAFTGNDYTLNPATDIFQTGLDILFWLEQQTKHLLQNRGLRSQVTVALSAWPRELSPELKVLCPGPSSRELSSILSDESISSSRFRLVQRLRDLSATGLYENEAFSRSDFWKLKESIPPEDRLLDDDVDAFASLLLLQKGSISGLGSDQTGQTIRTRHIRAVRELDRSSRTSIETLLATNRSIVVSLLAILHETASSQVYLAFRTLRSLVSVSNLDATSSRTLTSTHQAELEHLKAFPHADEPIGTPELDLPSLLLSSEPIQDFSIWVKQLTTIISSNLASKDISYSHLAVILQEDANFAEQALPVLVHATLLTELAADIPLDGTSLKTLLSNYFMGILSSESTAMQHHRVIVDTVLHLRNFRPPGMQDPLAHDKWLSVDYVLLSKSAITCGSYTTALLFLELAAEYREMNTPDSSAVEQIMYDIYSHIDEPDGFYGISTQDLRRFLLKRLQHEKQWEKAFQFYGASMEARSTVPDDVEGVLNSLHSFGFHRLAMSTLQGSPDVPDALNSSSMTYHLGWRTETWDLPEHTQDQNAGAPLYLALRAVHRERDPEVVESVVRDALVEEMGQLRVLGNENVASIHQVSQNLMCLSQVKEWLRPATQRHIQTGVDALSHWDSLHIDMDFGDFECIMATRISLIGSARQREEREQLGDLLTPASRTLIHAEARCLLDLSVAARLAGQTQIALNSIARAQKLKESSLEVSQEFAQVLWSMKEPKLAVQYAQNLVPVLESEPSDTPTSDYLRKAKLFTLLGTWTSEACLGNPVNIKTEYFDVAADLCEANVEEGSEQEHASIFREYAMFAERQYHAIARSPDMLRWRVYADRKAMEIESRKRSMEANRHNQHEHSRLKHLNRLAETQMKDDLLKVESHIQTRDTFLQQAIEMHSRSLATSDAYDDDSPIRLTSLWFANFGSTENNLQSRIGRALSRIPSRKFVFLAHQLSARLYKPTNGSEKTTENQENLQKLIIRMCREHPYHSLFPVFCLRSMDSQQSSSQMSMSTSRRHSSVLRLESSSQDTRANAATDIFNRLRDDNTTGSRVSDMEAICIASLEFAKYPIKANPPKSHEAPQIPTHLLIRKIKNIQVPVITAHTPLDPTQKYEDCVWIDHFENTYRTAGGVNLPKIANCIGNDGKQYKQLFKGEGNDDLRQDAVMEQVFELVNMVLCRDRDTAKRDLKVRVYKVIPLSSQAGVLEFVGNTIPMMSYVSPAHPRYRPKDIGVKELQKQMTDCGKPYRDPKRLTDLFIKLRDRFKPVMRNFFTEYHKTPTSWFKMRLNYSRSVATTSIVGHILGLGDRHCSNILIDTSRGDVVHIDLGIAFEQGKLLPIPERVPFRLTADIVDGLGTTGTQGVFQRCAEETLRVMRAGSEVILTVLEVFKYDPLHSWTASELKIQRAQPQTKQEEKSTKVKESEPQTKQLDPKEIRDALVGIDYSATLAEEAADRALSAVRRKLDKTLSVEFTVNELIAEATDPANLGNMYIGWGPQY